MPLREKTLENQLETAKEHLRRVEHELGDSAGKKQPKWRQANARVRQIESRIEARGSSHGGSSTTAEEEAE